MNTLNEAALQLAVAAALSGRADRAGAWLVDALSQEGSGLLHEGNPRRSSTPEEMPAPQTEALLHSIDVRQEDARSYAVGSFADMDAEGYAHAEELESRPPSAGGRAFLEHALADPDLQQTLRGG